MKYLLFTLILIAGILSCNGQTIDMSGGGGSTTVTETDPYSLKTADTTEFKAVIVNTARSTVMKYTDTTKFKNVIFEYIDEQDALKAPLTAPTLITPILGVATATSINGNTIPAGTKIISTTTDIHDSLYILKQDILKLKADVSYLNDLVFAMVTPFSPAVNAGRDTTLINAQAYYVSSSDSIHCDSINWTTSGTGTFDNHELLYTTYTPSVADWDAGYIVLTITGYYPTGQTASDNMTLTLTYPLARYIDADGSDDNNGKQPWMAWASITKVNAEFAALSAGTSVLFNKTDTFSGTITTTRSGVIGSPITLGSYGTGAKPIITGFTDISGGWANVSGNIYRKSVTTSSAIKYLIVNGVSYQKGRWPNTGKYLTTAGGSRTTFADATNLTQADDYWNGAEAVIITKGWTQEIETVLDFTQSTHLITLSAQLAFATAANNYYFLQNNIHCLTEVGDWMWDGTYVYLYYGSDPSSLKIEASTIDRAINLADDNYIDIEGIKFTGFNDAAIYTTNSHHVNVTGNDFFRCVYGVNATGGYSATRPNNITVTENDLRDIYMSAIYIRGAESSYPVSAIIIDSNVINDVGLDNSVNELGLSGISLYYANTSLITKNDIDSTGYSAIHTVGLSNTTIEKNRGMRYCLVLDDGGGIYTAGSHVGDTIRNNYFEASADSVFATGGTASYYAIGVYLDTYNTNVYVSDNLAVKNSRNYFDHAGNHNSFIDNWATKSTFTKLSSAWGGSELSLVQVVPNYVHDDVIMGNKLITNYRTSYSERCRPLIYSTTQDNVCDSNYLLLPTGNYTGYTTTVAVGPGETKMTLAQWIADDGGTGEAGDVMVWSALDTHTSQEEFVSYDYNFSGTARQYAFVEGWTYYEPTTGAEVSSLLLQPYEGHILYRINDLDL